MDVKMPVLPHNNADVLKSQQDRLISAIDAVKTETKKAAHSLPPLHSLLTSLDAVQGARELEKEKLSHASQPAFVVDIKRGQKEQLSDYAQGAFAVELNR